MSRIEPFYEGAQNSLLANTTPKLILYWVQGTIFCFAELFQYHILMGLVFIELGHYGSPFYRGHKKLGLIISSS